MSNRSIERGRASLAASIAVLAVACGSSENAMEDGARGVLPPAVTAGQGAGTSGAVLPGSPSPGTAGMAGIGPAPAGTGAIGGGAGAPPIGGTGPAAGSAAVAGTGGDPSGVAGAAGTSAPTQPPGPDDGDPNAPVFTTPEVACGGASGGFGGGSANFMLDGRQMIVTYPCEKHAGAPMIFFLNLHGTTPLEQHFYQHRYFAAHTLAASHNLIVVTPSSVVEQWGNGDNGQDEPHLMHIIDWVYATFHGDGKFDIRAMWVGGHSWGAMYTTTFVCKPYLEGKIKGAVIMSGIGRNPACASAISVISTAAEDDIGPVVDQGTVPMSHGCDAAQMNMIGNNEETHWPACDPGFVHANYFMLGKMHASSIDAEVVKRIADLMVEARP